VAREVQIVTWCDFCLAEDAQTEGVEYAGLNSGGARVVVDLCDEHYADYIEPGLSIYDTYGRTEAKAPRAHRKSAAAPGPCPECDKEFTSAQSLGMHRWRKHGVASQHRKDKKAS